MESKITLKIAVSSGKGGTGKTFISTNIAAVLEKSGKQIRYLDCDVEEPNGHLFLKPEIIKEEEIIIDSPGSADMSKCNLCGKCQNACRYNAIALIKDKVLFFKNLCHVCGACKIVCSANAIVAIKRKIGEIKHGKKNSIDFHYGLLDVNEPRMTVALIKEVKKNTGDGINILDSPPGTACPVVETIKDADLCILVTDPTPFGINDLKLAVDMARELGQEPVVLVNRAEYKNDDLKNYLREADLELLGEIPDDREIAEIYSVGDLVVEKSEKYKKIFDVLADKILERVKNKQSVRIKPDKIFYNNVVIEKTEPISLDAKKPKELVIISGKGGTGKTSIAAAFCALAKKSVIADCDVDASDLHLVLKPELKKKGYFSGGSKALIDSAKCQSCGFCFDKCKFDAVKWKTENNKTVYFIEQSSCEGCGVCGLVCNYGAVSLKEAINGEWFLSETRFGPMAHAKLGAAEENSGKLVSLIRNKKNRIANEQNINISIIDGSPGTGCPVVASIAGCDYAVIVTEPTVSGIHDMKRILDVINYFKIKSGIIVNKYDLNPAKSDEAVKIAAQNNSNFLGMIPYDESVTDAQIEGISIIEYTENKVTKQIRKIWDKIKDECFK